MNKIIRFINHYLIIGFVFILVLIAWDVFGKPGSNSIEKMLREVLSWNMMLWFATLVLFFVLLVVVPSMRDKMLKRLANLKERDEREQYITGKAARTAYISTLSLLIFLLFISIITVTIERIPADQVIKNNNHHLQLNISAGFSLVDEPEIKMNDKERQMIFSSKNIIPSKPAMILILLFWQLFIFNIIARKEQKE